MNAYLTARECQELINNGGSHSSLQATIMTAIMAAVTNKAKSCTVSMRNKAGTDVLPIRSALIGLGYTLTQDGSDLTIKWA